jgi:hypothetical protein
MTVRLYDPGARRARWRDPAEARACGWVAALGAGPFEVAAVADHSGHGRRPGLVLRTDLGEVEVCEVWLAPDD